MLRQILRHQCLNAFHPDYFGYDLEVICEYALFAEDAAVLNLSKWSDFASISSVDPLNSRQYAVFLVFLTNTLYKHGHVRESDVCACLNKSLNSCEIFGHVRIPDYFHLGHTSGLVLGKCSISQKVVFYQGVTVGAWKNMIPTLLDGCVLMQNSTVAGASVIGENSIIAPGTVVVGQSVPKNVIAMQLNGRNLSFKAHDGSFPSSFWQDF